MASGALTFTLGLTVGIPLGILVPSWWLMLLWVGAVIMLAFLFWWMALKEQQLEQKMFRNRVLRLSGRNRGWW